MLQHLIGDRISVPLQTKKIRRTRKIKSLQMITSSAHTDMAAAPIIHRRAQARRPKNSLFSPVFSILTQRKLDLKTYRLRRVIRNITSKKPQIPWYSVRDPSPLKEKLEPATRVSSC